MPIFNICSRCGQKYEYGKECANGCMSKAKKERYKQYAKFREDKNEQRFYSSQEWINLAEWIRRKFNGMCVVCLVKDNVISYVEAVHHIIEIKEDWDLRLSEDNLICLCSSCHGKVHRLYKKSAKDKEQMQEILYRLIEQYNEEYGLD